VTVAPKAWAVSVVAPAKPSSAPIPCGPNTIEQNSDKPTIGVSPRYGRKTPFVTGTQHNLTHLRFALAALFMGVPAVSIGFDVI